MLNLSIGCQEYAHNILIRGGVGYIAEKSPFTGMIINFLNTYCCLYVGLYVRLIVGKYVLYKIVLVGESRSGKTALRLRYIDQRFTDAYMRTIGLDFSQKTRADDECEITLAIWDIDGDNREHLITRGVSRGCHGLIVNFDLSSLDSFQRLEQYMERAVKPNYPENATIMLAANKSDLDPAVDKEAISQFVQEWNQKNPTHQIRRFFATSAKKNTDVTELFDETVLEILRSSHSKAPDEMASLAPDLKTQFKQAYEAKLESDRGKLCGLFRFFAKSRIEDRLDNMSLSDILRHAKSANNRSRAVCVALGWLTPQGHLASSLPEAASEELENAESQNRLANLRAKYQLN
ncbi:Ras family GTPase [Legionella geestiana]|uniref:Ras family GTPase n=1 Tax=Legionella geestiana TaxID=45065 RepID=A0A0W0U865_9GAMM|nr:Rab family GTPase [Legionella geestiana]KTD04005.1 Ras family GTPase [Legionella geestiana]QBS12863.1 GTP-binding protein [Legionella geestiana]STX54650.1 Ras family GTPase [Legionella geestiana]